MWAGSRVGESILVLVSMVISLGMAEIVIRFVPSLQVAKEPEQHFCSPEKRRHIRNTELGYTEIPGNTYFEKGTAEEHWYFVKVNTDGFRDNYDTGPRQVIMLGDSILRGTLVSESQTFGYLLDLWYPDITFRAFGAGGWGQANQLRAYETLVKVSHKLVILVYTTSNDINDNAERATWENGRLNLNLEWQVSKGPQSPVFKLHRVLWNSSALYPLVFETIVKPLVGRRAAQLSMDEPINVTRLLLSEIARRVQANNAELLVVIIPSWNELKGFADGMAYGRQHEMLRQLAEANPSVTLLDTTSELAIDPHLKFGLIDTHLNAYGQFLVASKIDQWLSMEWKNGPMVSPAPHQFVQEGITQPDCALADEYARRLAQP